VRDDRVGQVVQLDQLGRARDGLAAQRRRQQQARRDVAADAWRSEQRLCPLRHELIDEGLRVV